MKVAIGNDKKGFQYKTIITGHLLEQGVEVIDLGSEDVISDYPIYAYKVSKHVKNGQADFGILICSSGIGMSIAANKVDGIRCGIGYNKTVAQKMREHNDANVIAIGQDYSGIDDALGCIDVFLSTDFVGLHHTDRINQIAEIENGVEIKEKKI